MSSLTNPSLAKSLRQYMQSTFRVGYGTVSPRSLYGIQAPELKVAMDEAYHYKIGANEFDPGVVFPEVLTLSNQLSTILHQLTPAQETKFENHILHCLASMVYGSNMIERAGGDSDSTFGLCTAIFLGKAVEGPEEIEEMKEEFQIPYNKLLADISPALRSYREIAQHARAASYIIGQLCIHDQDLSEEIILQTHKILTYKVDAETTPWEEYSGVYRTDEVSAGLHPFPHHSIVPFKMKGMVRDLQSDVKEAIAKGTLDPISMASKYTHIFVNIHPFIDGNGRMCRLILNSMLLKLGSFLACIGGTEEERTVYMEIASNGGALEDLYGDLDEDEKPVMHKELGSLVLEHVKESMQNLVTMLL
ncbi:uncharacterized protein N7518_000964 [Penicillium psychrosexuale]|uniref:uncharacterized protein n=1 Tax=Penicillium psychrosexuale TaxID=1002107 RepID=UPI0025451177|nr:uncharacterized protein N7518_000964 [Penicillium psychrosexuale]KAJ5804661.1 hypothetical protein N7518_000964 [Penicillium psychrosexuale]